MRNTVLLIAGLAAAVSVGGCTRDETRHGLRGAGIGAVGGAVAGAIVPGLGVAEGAAIGAAGGAAVGVATSDHDRNWRRDSRGREYYIDRNGNRVYR
ncbi:hypothetical protein [Sphingobium estronivorans]|uniref:hypothetical protein n=1 Tax=Sphingobium estronivorans TaxID=1577690 RepID=UPI00123B45B3|nr:hypothetical protein [Sphingobium estronivorans]